MSVAPSVVVSTNRTPSSCGRSGGTIGAGMTAMPFTLSVSSFGGGNSRVTVMRGFSVSVALMHGSIRSQSSSASVSGQTSVVDVEVVVGTLVVDELELLDDVLLLEDELVDVVCVVDVDVLVEDVLDEDVDVLVLDVDVEVE